MVNQILLSNSPRDAHMALLYEGHFPALDQARIAWKDVAQWCCKPEVPAGWSIERVEELSRAYFDVLNGVLECALRVSRSLGLTEHVVYFEAITKAPNRQIQPAQIRLPGF